MQKNIIRILCVLLVANLAFSGYLYYKLEHPTPTKAFTSVKEAIENGSQYTQYICDMPFEDYAIGISGAHFGNGFHAWFFTREKKGSVVEYSQIQNGYAPCGWVYEREELKFVLDEAPLNFQEFCPDVWFGFIPAEKADSIRVALAAGNNAGRAAPPYIRRFSYEGTDYAVWFVKTEVPEDTITVTFEETQP